MAHVFVTGSSDGLGRGAALELLAAGHRVVVHARNPARAPALKDLVDRGAELVVGDLAEPDETHDLAHQVARLGRMDAVIHNAGTMQRPVLPVNVVAPYLLSVLLERPRRLVFLSSGMHRSGRADLSGFRRTGSRRGPSYSDSKLMVTALAAAFARLWPEVPSNAVDPGWVPTKMGGPSAPDDLRLGHVTQVWLAVSTDPEALTTGGYWHHQQRQEPHRAVHDVSFQDDLLHALAERTGVDV
ncbi:SDR family NAD(P)-dependent oxidoreductase [Isoptericola sp. b441]|uniref:SDR family NAD(P)-dependent oxidoreductase n=1 Tax=Actinotalea lenta TaxID=3064654 RepID=A0ABT9D776_9CELL|nr:SDR family NAD(P)-dependent oxidoreductase [Isoptericola sp. b441]MDO8106694.1 SDR family NAD(P)-dependent oxidoreductase [Isoptericola sp. b441]